MTFHLTLVETVGNFLANPYFLFCLTIFLFWLGYVITQRPRCENKIIEEAYIDDSKISKMELYICTMNWGTRLFPFRSGKLLDVDVSSKVKLSYVPPGGIEREIDQEYYRDTPVKNKICKPLKITNISHFKKQKINRIRVVVQTPFERQNYESKIMRATEGNILKIWNENTEQIRNFKLLLSKPVKIKNVQVIEGTIDSLDLEISYSAINLVKGKRIGEVNSDVSLSVILDLPAKKIDVEKFVKIQMS